MVVVFCYYQPWGCSTLFFVVSSHTAHIFVNSPFIKFSLNSHFECASWVLLGSRLKYTLNTESGNQRIFQLQWNIDVIYSVLLILLMRKQRQRDLKRFVQSHQPLHDRLGTRTQISESLWCSRILCRRSLAQQKVFIDGVHPGQLAPGARPVDKCSTHRSFWSGGYQHPQEEIQ